MNDENEIGKGWGFPLNTRKAHYFDNDAISMCGKWMYMGQLEDNNHTSPDNCAICKRKREKQYGNT